MEKLAGRGARRKSDPDLFLSHSSKDKEIARKLAIDLTFCGVDVWLDEWEIQIGQSLVDVIGRSMSKSKYIAILMSENFNTTYWTNTEYKKALALEQKKGQIVILPLLLGGDNIPDFLEDKVYLDLRKDYYAGIARLTAVVHGISEFPVARALEDRQPESITEVWDLLEGIGFEPYVIVEGADFDEILRNGGQKINDERAFFSPEELLKNDNVSAHIKSLMKDLMGQDVRGSRDSRKA